MTEKGRPPNKYSYQEHDRGEAYRLHFDKTDGTRSLKWLGSFRSVNRVMIGPINPDWDLLEGLVQARISDEHRQKVENLLLNFACERASEEGAIPWKDKEKGLIDCAQRIDKAAKSLLETINEQVPAMTYLLTRLQQIDDKRFEGTRFSRDEFYPQLTQLVSRADFLLQALTAEKKRGVRLGIGNAWRNFVFGMASVYREATGKQITTPELSDRNAATSKPSPFLMFAHNAMLQIPEELREHTTGGGENGIYSFSSKLSETATELGLRQLKKIKSRNPR